MLPIEESVRWFVDWLLQASWQASVVVGAVLLVQWLAGRRLSAVWRYRLWMLVAIRLVLPVVPASGTSIYNVLRSERWASPQPQLALAWWVHANADATDGVLGPGQASTSSAMSSWRRLDWRVAVFLMWLAGAATATATLLRTQFRFQRRIEREPVSADPMLLQLLDRCKQALGMRRYVAVICTDAVASPAITGLWRPKLLLPRRLIGTLDSSELRFVFLHELTHLKCLDVILDWLVAFLRAIHWFNPVIRLAARQCRVDREVARDAAVLRAGRPDEEQQYGRTILKLVEQLGYSNAAPGVMVLLDEHAPLERRIRMIASFKRNAGGGAVLAIGLMLVVGCMTLTGREAPATKDAGPPAAAKATAPPALPKRADGAPPGAVLVQMHLLRAPDGFVDEALGQAGGQPVPNSDSLAPVPAAGTGQGAGTLHLSRDAAQKLREAAQAHSQVSILAAPRLIIPEGQWGTVMVGQELPIAAGATNASAQPQTVFAGTKISVRPVPAPNGKGLFLDVNTVVTSPRDPAHPAGGNFDSRTLETRAEMDSGATLVSGFTEPEANSADGHKLKLLLLLEASPAE